MESHHIGGPAQTMYPYGTSHPYCTGLAQDHDVHIVHYLDSESPPRIYQQLRNDKGNLTKKAALLVVLEVTGLNQRGREAFANEIELFTLYSSGDVPGYWVDADNSWGSKYHYLPQLHRFDDNRQAWKWVRQPDGNTWRLHAYFERDNGALDVSSNHRNCPFILVCAWPLFTSFSSPFKIESKEPEDDTAANKRLHKLQQHEAGIMSKVVSEPPARPALLEECKTWCEGRRASSSSGGGGGGGEYSDTYPSHERGYIHQVAPTSTGALDRTVASSGPMMLTGDVTYQPFGGVPEAADTHPNGHMPAMGYPAAHFQGSAMDRASMQFKTQPVPQSQPQAFWPSQPLPMSVPRGVSAVTPMVPVMASSTYTRGREEAWGGMPITHDAYAAKRQMMCGDQDVMVMPQQQQQQRVKQVPCSHGCTAHGAAVMVPQHQQRQQQSPSQIGPHGDSISTSCSESASHKGSTGSVTSNDKENAVEEEHDDWFMNGMFTEEDFHDDLPPPVFPSAVSSAAALSFPQLDAELELENYIVAPQRRAPPAGRSKSKRAQRTTFVVLGNESDSEDAPRR